MTKLAYVCGAVLVGVGLAGYFATGQESSTALIPTWFGVGFLISAIIAGKNQKHGMHLAAVLALLGAIGGIMPLKRAGFDLGAGSAPYALAMIVVCLVFLVAAVRFFVRARILKK